METSQARSVDNLKLVMLLYNVKSKAVPSRSIEVPLGDRRYSSCSFLTSALEGGEWSASRPGRALPPDKEPPVPILEEAGWAPEPVWTKRLEEKSSVSIGDRTPAVQSVVRHYTELPGTWLPQWEARKLAFHSAFLVFHSSNYNTSFQLCTDRDVLKPSIRGP
jgi:hypothetical protein